MNRRTVCMGYALLVIVAGLMLRLAPLGLPIVIVKYGGSALWALMIYWLTCALRPAMSTFHAAAIAFGIAASSECLKLMHTPGLDAFRLTLAGKLLLGRVFSLLDLLVYAGAISVQANLSAGFGGRLGQVKTSGWSP